MDNYLFLPRSAAAALTDTAFALAFGIALLGLWLPQTGTPSLTSSLRRSLRISSLIMLLALPVQMYLAAAAMIGSTDLDRVRGLFTTVVGDTHAGRNLLLQSALIVLLLATLRITTKPWPLLTALLLLAAARAASGHAASEGDFTLRELVQWVHLASIATWAGGVMAAGLVAVPTLLREQQQQPARTLMRRLSTTVTIALPLIILSGLYNAYHGLAGSLAPLRNTQWGGLLDAKTLLVFAALIFGAMNRRILRPQADFTQPQAKRLARLLRAEAILMLIILTLSAFLANSPPADMSGMAM